MTEQEEAQFEAWWESDGQYMRAGGGKYEKTFAYEAWRHQQQRIAELEKAAALSSQDRVMRILADHGIGMCDGETVYPHEGEDAVTYMTAIRAVLADKPNDA